MGALSFRGDYQGTPNSDDNLASCFTDACGNTSCQQSESNEMKSEYDSE